MRLQRLLVALLSIALLGLPALVLGAGPATAAATNSRIIAELDSGMPQAKNLADYHASVTVRGQLQGEITPGTWGYVPGQTVSLERVLAGATTTEVLGTTVTDASGNFTFITPAESNAVYRVRFAGATLGPDSLNPTVTPDMGLQVMRNFNPKKKDLPGPKIKFTGKIAPKYAKKKLTLQLKKGKTWKKVATIRTDRKSRWEVVLTATSRRKTYYRLISKADTRYVLSGVIFWVRRA